jgi:hypothetical protein
MVIAAGTKIIAPAAMIHNPSDIPFLKPVFLSTAEDGNAITKYET